MKRGVLFMVIALAMWLFGCADSGKKTVGVVPVGDKTVQASGIGRFDDSGSISVNQRWLGAQQSAKLDAYRALAADLYQQKLSDGSTVGKKVVSNEAYRIYLDNYLRQAWASDYRTVRDRLRTTLDLKLTPRFYACMSGDVAVVNRCLQEDNKLGLTRLGFKPALAYTTNLACSSADCSDLLSVKGFSKQHQGFDDALLDVGMYDSEWWLQMGVNLILGYAAFYSF